MTTRSLPLLLLCALLFTRAFAAEGAITREEVFAAQKSWGDAIVAIGKAATDKTDYPALARELVGKLYAFGVAPTVLFKPTKAAEPPFRPDLDSAVSYFVGGGLPEDHGFALQPWSQVRFADVNVVLLTGCALSMGHYYFMDANTGKETMVEFTFAYLRDAQGQLRIVAHHSSLPYQPHH